MQAKQANPKILFEQRKRFILTLLGKRPMTTKQVTSAMREHRFQNYSYWDVFTIGNTLSKLKKQGLVVAIPPYKRPYSYQAANSETLVNANA